MVVPIVARKRKEKNKKSFFLRALPFILGTGFIAMVIAVLVVAITTGIKLFAYFQ